MRFIVNLPQEELSSVERICFQVEEAQWFYEDFIRPLDPNLPSLNLRQFCLRIFQHCPMLSGYTAYHHSTAFSEFLAYKTRVPVRGAIMLNEAMDEVVLVKGWKKNANWSFPRGKINKDEKDLDCAIREVYEETGFDIQAANLESKEEDLKYIEVTMREQHMRLYVFRGVPMDTNFEPRTRKEISKIQWYKLSELPTLKKMRQQQQEGRGEDLALSANKFYMVAPFLTPLKKWISQQKKLDAMNGPRIREPVFEQESTPLQVAEILNTQRVAEDPSSSDMTRLMTQLRQSGQTQPTSQLSELSGPLDNKANASAQLKNLLKVPLVNCGHEDEERASSSQDEKASAMLSLLRSGANSNPTLPDQPVRLSSTPSDQVLEALSIDPSAQHSMGKARQVPSLPPAPIFPDSPTQVENHHERQTMHSWEEQAPLSQAALYPSSQQRQIFTAHTHRVPPFMVAPPGRQALAPYQRTGDPQFAANAQLSQSLPPSIPPANALPPPKLTSHSSALLDLFKTDSSARTAPAETTSQPLSVSQDVTQPTLQYFSNYPTSGSLQHPTQRTDNYGQHPLAPHATVSHPVLVVPPSVVVRPRSQQQETLLNILRMPSSQTLPTAHTSSPSLAPPSTLVELSAQPSPSHSRVSSQVRKDTANVLLMNGHTRIQKRPGSSRHASQGPLSATVTGPLNFPQFDKILKNPAKGKDKDTNGSNGQRADPSNPQLQPVAILSRPAVESKARDPHEISGRGSPKMRKRDPSRQQSHIASHSAKQMSPHPFQPQILRRPAEKSQIEGLQIAPAAPAANAVPKTEPAIVTTPVAAPAPMANDSFPLDRLASQSQEQKDALLLLFSKPYPVSFKTPTTASKSAIGSPVAETPFGVKNLTPIRTGSIPLARADSFVPSPLELSRSRIGSWTAANGDGIVSGNGSVKMAGVSARQTPKASPIDKKFLLGFLDGVVRESSK